MGAPGPSGANDRALKEQYARALREKYLREERKRQSDPNGGLMHFIRHFWHVLEPVDEFVEGWPLECLCAHLEAITRGDTIEIAGHERPFNRFLANVCPGFMKSLTCNAFWPAWEWGPMGFPHLRYLSFSYSPMLTERDNAKFRDLITSAAYRELWGHVFNVVGDGKIRVTNDKTGFKFASSFGSVATGERGHRVICLPQSEPILTDRGWLPIGSIVNERIPVRVAGLNHDTNEVIWQDIEAYESNPGNEIFEIACEGGVVRCTGDHPIFVPGIGYARADSLQGGEQVVWAGERFPLPPLQDSNSSQPEGAPEILQSGMSICRGARVFEDAEQPSLRGVRGDGVSAACAHEALPARLLQSCLPRGGQCWKRQSSLYWVARRCVQVLREAVQEKSRNHGTGILFVSLLSTCNKGGDPAALGGGPFMSSLFGAVCGVNHEAEILHSQVRRHSACEAYEGTWQRSVCSRRRRASISAWMDAHAQGSNQSAGWKLLCSVRTWARSKSEPRCPSHRLREGELGSSEPDNALPLVPRQDAWGPRAERLLATRVVRSVRKIGSADITYNIRVSPCHNYFASGVLVHNCDDPHALKGTQESPEARATVTTWVREAMQNRLNDLRRDAIVVIMQRLYQDDASGSIMEHLSDEYCHLIIPMEYEANRHFSHYTGWNNGEDPRTYDGELAWPERYPEESLASFKRNHYLWAGQYQQTPVPRGGGLFKDDWWQIHEVTRKDGKLQFIPELNPVFVLGSLDTAFSENEQNDYSAMTVWAVYDDPKSRNRRIILVDGWQKRLSELSGYDLDRREDETILPNMTPAERAKCEARYVRRTMPRWGLIEWVNHTCTRRRVDLLIIENKNRAHDVNKEIRRLCGDRSWGVQLVNVKGDKWARAHSVVDLFTDDMVHVPAEVDDNGNVKYLDFADLLINEMSIFPKGAHDDIVDSAVHALRYLRQEGYAIRREERTAAESALMKHRPQRSPLYEV